MLIWLEKMFVSLGVAQKAAGDLAVVVLMVLVVAAGYLVYWVLRN